MNGIGRVSVRTGPLREDENLLDWFEEAISRGDLRKVQSLIENGAPLDLKDEEGETLLHMAARHGHVAIVEFLVLQGADPLAEDGEGQTPLQLAKRLHPEGLVMNSLNHALGRP